jgi:acetyl esterase/lipase
MEPADVLFISLNEYTNYLVLLLFIVFQRSEISALKAAKTKWKRQGFCWGGWRAFCHSFMICRPDNFFRRHILSMNSKRLGIRRKSLIIYVRKCFWLGMITAYLGSVGRLSGQIPVEAWPIKTPIIPNSVKVTCNLFYGSHPQNVLDLLEPKGSGGQERPGVLLIHGGGWIGGSRDWVAEHVALRYVEKGFVCANVEYRQAPTATAPAAVEDVLQATRWFVKNARQYRVDPHRIVVTGDSAGGHLALMAGITPKSARLGPQSRVSAIVNFFGITDVNDQLLGPNQRDYTVQWVPEQPGREELARRVSPLTYLGKNVPPVLTVHGTCDPSVPYSHAVRLTDGLNRSGAQAILITVPGGGHGFPKAQTDEIYSRFVWPFLFSIGIIKNSNESPVSPPAVLGTLSCAPVERCGFLNSLNK